MRRIARYLVIAFCCVLATYFLWKESIKAGVNLKQTSSPESDPEVKLESWQASSGILTKMVVMGKLSTQDTDWVQEHLPDWDSSIYVVDNTSAPVHTARNKGREANAYLTFIIENYGNLPDTNVFIHNHRDGFPAAWHTDAVHHDMVLALGSINIDYVQEQGYVNLRCNPDPGCYGLVIEPGRHRDDAESLSQDATAEVAWLDAWPKLNLMGEKEVPEAIAAACCAQFAVSREQILKRPLDDYVRYHEWLMDTSLSDEASGRIMEYSWHMMFGKEPVHCPDMMECYMYLYPGKNPYGIDANGEAISGPPL